MRTYTHIQGATWNAHVYRFACTGCRGAEAWNLSTQTYRELRANLRKGETYCKEQHVRRKTHEEGNDPPSDDMVVDVSHSAMQPSERQRSMRVPCDD